MLLLIHEHVSSSPILWLLSQKDIFEAVWRDINAKNRSWIGAHLVKGVSITSSLVFRSTLASCSTRVSRYSRDSLWPLYTVSPSQCPASRRVRTPLGRFPIGPVAVHEDKTDSSGAYFIMIKCSSTDPGIILHRKQISNCLHIAYVLPTYSSQVQDKLV